MQALYAFVGGGNMGRALVGGLLQAGHPVARLRVADPLPDSRAACAEAFGVAVFADNAEAVTDADVVVLAVKPQQMAAVARALAPSLGARTLALSIAAGITTAQIAAWLGGPRAIVRAMPNTPALVGRGAAALYATPEVDAEQRTAAQRLLEAVGIAVWIEDEALMNAVTALSGSGPAYVFMLIELLQSAGERLGLARELARELALQTVYGAAKLARESEHDAATLRAQVTSPGGTTERAIATFAEHHFDQIVLAALTAARDRAVELARESNVS